MQQSRFTEAQIIGMIKQQGRNPKITDRPYEAVFRRRIESFEPV